MTTDLTCMNGHFVVRVGVQDHGNGSCGIQLLEGQPKPIERKSDGAWVWKCPEPGCKEEVVKRSSVLR